MSQARDRLPRIVVALVLATALLGAGVLPALAQPSSQELRSQRDDDQARLDELMMQAAEVVEDYNEATVALEQAEAELATTEAERSTLNDELGSLTALAEDHVRRIHKLGPSLELSSIFVAGSPTDAGAKAATLRRVLAGQWSDLERLGATRTAVAATEARLAEQQEAAEERRAVVAERRDRLDTLVASQQDEIRQLESQITQAVAREEEERRLEEERRRREAEERLRQQQVERERQQQQRQRQQQQERQRQAAQPRTTSNPPATSNSSPAPAPAPAPAPTAAPAPAPAPAPTAAPAPSTRSSAQTAVDTAMAQVGKPYRFGGSGPNNFDCSGLTSFAWRAAGVDITRTSRSQYAATRRIGRGDLQPGDLIFYGRSVGSISHVAMFIGGGSVVEAPYTGANVRVRGDGLSRRDIVGYGRP